MLKTKNPLFLVPFKYGLVGSILNILALLVLYYLGSHPLLLSPIFDTRLPLYALFIFVGYKVFKDEYNNRIMHFWQGMTLGMIIYIVMALLTSSFIYIFGEIESTKFLSEYIRIATGQLVVNKEMFIESIGEKTFIDTIAQLPQTRSIHLATDYLLKSIPIGLFLTIILSVLMRNKISTNTK
jgi:putative flippase GtrA